MQLINGNAIAQTILEEVTQAVKGITSGKPAIAFVRVGEDAASISYVSKKQKVARQVGIESELHLFPETVSKEELLSTLHELNQNPRINGILVQAPLPKHLNEAEVFNSILPQKDVDGFHTVNLGKLCQDDPSGFVACTPSGIVELLKRSRIETEGKHVVVIGRSLIVGKPAALLMLKKGLGGDATVTVCHSKTTDMAAHTSRADILIAAIGRPQTITADMVKEGAVVIDVGINRVKDSSKKSGYRLVGDVDFEAVAPKTSGITPVPGGVGPLTVAMLMKNTLKAFQLQHA